MDNSSLWRFPHLNTAYQTELGSQLPFPVSHPVTAAPQQVNTQAESAACADHGVLVRIIQLLEAQDVSDISLTREHTEPPPALGQLDAIIIQHRVSALLPSPGGRVAQAAASAAAPAAAPAAPPAPEQRQAGPTPSTGGRRHHDQRRRTSPVPQQQVQQQEGVQQQQQQQDPVLPPSKRRRISSEEQEDVPPPISAAEVAGPLAQKIAAFISKAESLMPDEQMDDDDEDDPAAPEPYITTAMLKQLSEEVQHGKQHNALSLLDQAVVMQLLEILHHHIKLGLSLFIQRDDGDAAASYRNCILAVSAANVALHLLTAADMPKAVYMEELVVNIISLLKYQLQYNVLAFWDDRLWKMWRSSQDDEETSTNKKGSAKKPPKTVQTLIGHLQVTAQLAAGLMQVVKVDPNALSPLVRMLLTSLTVEGVQDFQAKAIVCLVSIFHHDSSQRQGLLDELLNTTITGISSAKNPPRHCPVKLDGNKHIQMCSALIIQLVQGSATVPPPGTAAADVLNSFGWAHTWADMILASLLDNLPLAKATKSDTSTDFKQIMENLITDLLQVQHQPEWAAANTLLKRFANALGTERCLKSSDGSVRLMSIDYLGQLVQQLCADSKHAEAQEQWLQQYMSLLETEAEGEELDRTQELTRAVVLHLARSPGPLAASACEFMCTRYLSDQLAAHKLLYNKDANDEEVAAYLKQARLLSDRRASNAHASSSTSLDREQAAKVVLALNMEGTLGKGKAALIRWLVDAGDRQRQDSNQAGARAKAIKWLGQVIAEDQSLLGLAEVQTGVRNALLDDAVSVREAAVDLVGRHIGTDRELALAYFDVMCKASKDQGITVRKRAVKILHEFCVQWAQFPRASQAVIHIMYRVADHEESMRGLVTKFCSELWFTPPETSELSKSPMLRAQQLAHVAMEAYTAGGQGIHLPLASDHALVMIMKEMLTQDSKAVCQKACRAGAQEVAAALLELVLEQLDASGANGSEISTDEAMLPYLLALHAICMADMQLCMPKNNPAKFVQTLQPFITSDPAVTAEPGPKREVQQRRSAERTICILSIVDTFCRHARSVDAAVVEELVKDFKNILNKHPFVVVVAAACRCACSLARLNAVVAMTVAKLTKALHAAAAKQLAASSPTNQPLLGRFCYTLGNMCRYGASILESAPGELQCLSLQQYLEFLVDTFNNPLVHPKTQDIVLQAIGMVCIARPEVLVFNRDVTDILRRILQPGADMTLKQRALGNLIDLLKCEEDGMIEAQKQAGETSKLATLASTNPAKQESRTLAKQNGLGDGSSMSSGVLQQLWNLILDLAKDVAPAPAANGHANGASPGASPSSCTNVRRRALELMEVTLRGGLVAPWTAIPSLVTLTTDGSEDISAKAIRILKMAADRYSDMVGNSLAKGIQEAYGFQRRLWQAGHPGQPMPKKPAASVTRGLSQLYQGVVFDGKGMKALLLSSLLKPFDDAACVISDHGARGSDLSQLAFLVHVAAELGYKRMDEPLSIIHSLDDILQKRSVPVISSFQAALKEAHGAQGHADDLEDDVLHTIPDQGLPAKALASLQVAVKAAQALSMLLILKQFLEAAYALAPERVNSFQPTGEKRRQEEKLVANRSQRLTFNLDVLNFRACEDASGQLLLEQFTTFRGLVDADAAVYKDHLAVLAADVADDEEGDAANRSHLPMNTPADAGRAGLRLFKADSKRGGRSTRGRGTRGGRSRGGGSTTAKKGTGTGRKKRAQKQDSDEDDDSDYDGTPQPRSVPKRRLEHALQ